MTCVPHRRRPLFICSAVVGANAYGLCHPREERLERGSHPFAASSTPPGEGLGARPPRRRGDNPHPQDTLAEFRGRNSSESSTPAILAGM